MSKLIFVLIALCVSIHYCQAKKYDSYDDSDYSSEENENADIILPGSIKVPSTTKTPKVSSTTKNSKLSKDAKNVTLKAETTTHQPTTVKSSGGGIFGFMKNMFSKTPKKNVTATKIPTKTYSSSEDSSSDDDSMEDETEIPYKKTSTKFALPSTTLSSKKKSSLLYTTGSKNKVTSSTKRTTTSAPKLYTTGSKNHVTSWTKGTTTPAPKKSSSFLDSVNTIFKVLLGDKINSIKNNSAIAEALVNSLLEEENKKSSSSYENDYPSIFSLIETLHLKIPFLTTVIRFYYAVPFCYQKHSENIINLENRFIKEPRICLLDKIDNLFGNINRTVFDADGMFLRVKKFYNNFNLKNSSQLFGLLEVAADERTLVQDIIEHVQNIGTAATTVLAGPKCLSQDIGSIFAQIKEEMTEFQTCVSQGVAKGVKGH